MVLNFFQTIIYFIYIIIWKGIIKKIIYFITRTHEIERILNSKDIVFTKYIKLSN